MNTIRVLIVDDLVMNRVLLSEIIEEMGANYSCVSNGKEAIEKIQNDKYDVVLMDIEMPVMNGFETTRFIRKKLNHPLNEIPVFAITAHDPMAFSEEYKGVGFNELISKPYTVEKIQQAINGVTLKIDKQSQ